MAVGYKAVFVSFNGIIPYMVYAKNWVAFMIVYHIHLTENTGFLDDLICQTKELRALQSGPNISVAYTLLEIQLLIIAFIPDYCN